ncbi:GPI-anchor transamidase isoform A [Micractinium conductrix]|uniref:GPI-anchor transamidase isoform A n=1 Tax=Micractinium conductrix TaxID=554055 RepID=A0A2P6VMP1_9CHLO|nr:GPI-anchor transamidase isoform A [Micractinium conductrix]|eukprot:PSC75371.1 GPI-anchor transamidase isoform A [Micractinium conductrix]
MTLQRVVVMCQRRTACCLCASRGVPSGRAGAATRLLLALLCSAAHLSAAVNTSAASVGEGPVDTWAVIVDSSRYWLNYRHAANALGIYQAVRRLGLPDSRILLMLADQPACSPRNVHPGRIYLAPGAGAAGAAAAASDPANLLPQDIELDYRGREVSAETVLRVLTGRHLPGTPASKRLRSGRRSRVLLYLTGHGGDEFLKFHDQEELLATDLAAALAQMHAAGRYGELLLLADTCQASSLYAHVTAPGVLALASSKLGQSSYAHHLDATIGLHVVDQASYHLHHFLTTRLPPDPAAADGVSAAASGGGSIRGSGSRTRGPSL